jgi:hypothetical protein
VIRGSPIAVAVEREVNRLGWRRVVDQKFARDVAGVTGAVESTDNKAMSTIAPENGRREGQVPPEVIALSRSGVVALPSDSCSFLPIHEHLHLSNARAVMRVERNIVISAVPARRRNRSPGDRHLWCRFVDERHDNVPHRY